MWSMLKRGCDGTHELSPKHLDRYLQQFANRHNHSEQDTIDMMGTAMLGMDGKAPVRRLDQRQPAGIRSTRMSALAWDPLDGDWLDWRHLWDDERVELIVPQGEPWVLGTQRREDRGWRFPSHRSQRPSSGRAKSNQCTDLEAVQGRVDRATACFARGDHPEVHGTDRDSLPRLAPARNLDGVPLDTIPFSPQPLNGYGIENQLPLRHT